MQSAVCSLQMSYTVLKYGKYVMYFVDWYEQHGGLARVYVSCFVVVIGRK